MIKNKNKKNKKALKLKYQKQRWLSCFVLWKRDKRRVKKGLLAANCLTNGDKCHPRRRKLDNASNNMIKKKVWTLEGSAYTT